ncbi:MAG: hypothetical protein AB7G15_01045 [Alphaproteobacteria bacterium]
MAMGAPFVPRLGGECQPACRPSPATLPSRYACYVFFHGDMPTGGSKFVHAIPTPFTFPMHDAKSARQNLRQCRTGLDGVAAVALKAAASIVTLVTSASNGAPPESRRARLR